MPYVCDINTYCGPGVKQRTQVLCNKRTRPNCYLTPQPCLSGFICTAGSETPKGTYVCPVGYFCPDGSLYTCTTFLEKKYDPNNRLQIKYDGQDEAPLALKAATDTKGVSRALLSLS